VGIDLLHLYPGDVLYTGTPEDEPGPPGDVMLAQIDPIGAMSVPTCGRKAWWMTELRTIRVGFTALAPVSRITLLHSAVSSTKNCAACAGALATGSASAQERAPPRVAGRSRQVPVDFSAISRVPARHAAEPGDRSEIRQSDRRVSVNCGRPGAPGAAMARFSPCPPGAGRRGHDGIEHHVDGPRHIVEPGAAPGTAHALSNPLASNSFAAGMRSTDALRGIGELARSAFANAMSSATDVPEVVADDENIRDSEQPTGTNSRIRRRRCRAGLMVSGPGG
jgi:hypothetical protein